MELRQLRYFVALAEELHFGRAAQRVHLAPAAFSEQIRRLERELGVDLVGRTSRRVWLTAAGAEMLPSVRAVLDDVDALAATARRHAREVAGGLRVGLSAVGIDLTATVVDAFRAQAPSAGVELVHAPFADPSAGLGSGDVDVALVWAPYDSKDQALFALRTERRAAILPASHPLADRPTVTVSDLLEERWVDVPSRDEVWRAFWTLDAFRAGAPVPFGGQASSPEGVLEVVAAGGGVAMLPVSQVERLPPGRVKAVVVADAPPCCPSVGLPVAPGLLGRTFARAAESVTDRSPEQDDGYATRH